MSNKKYFSIYKSKTSRYIPANHVSQETNIDGEFVIFHFHTSSSTSIPIADVDTNGIVAVYINNKNISFEEDRATSEINPELVINNEDWTLFGLYKFPYQTDTNGNNLDPDYRITVDVSRIAGTFKIVAFFIKD